MLNHHATLLALRGHLTGATSSLPSTAAWLNVDFSKPAPDVSWIEEDFLPATQRFVTVTQGADASHVAEHTGFYVVRVYTPIDGGTGPLFVIVDDILTAFAGNATIAIAGGDTVRVRTDVAPTASQPRADGSGWFVATVTIPWRLHTRVPAAA